MLQQPSPEDGDFFQREWFKRFDIGEQPPTVNFGAGDYAVSEGKGDFTDQGISGFDREEDLWILDWWYGQTSADVWINEQQRLAKHWKVPVWVAEGGVIRKATEPYIKKRMQRGYYYRLEWIVSHKDKAANARAFQALAAQGKVHIPNTSWGERLITQLLKFPYGKFDDAVDTCGLFGRILDQAWGPRVYVIEQDPNEKDGYETEDDEGEEWKLN